MIVLDSSAACDMVRKTEEGMAFRALMLSEEKVISCELLRAEVVSIFRKLCRHGLIPIEKVQSFLTESTALVNEYYSIQELQKKCFLRVFDWIIPPTICSILYWRAVLAQRCSLSIANSFGSAKNRVFNALPF